MPQELDKNERAIRRLEIEKQALKKEKDDASKERLKNLVKELEKHKERNIIGPARSGESVLFWPCYILKRGALMLPFPFSMS